MLYKRKIFDYYGVVLRIGRKVVGFMYIRRHMEQVVERIAKRKSVLVITGARQVGKSTMLKAMYPDTNYVALNNPLVRESAKNNPSIFFEQNKPPVIVDEIQKEASLFEYIKDIVDEKKEKGQFYLTGSQSLTLMKNVSDSLAGRAGIVKMLPLSQREILNIDYSTAFLPTKENLGATKNSFDFEQIAARIHKGFFPELYETESDLRDWADYYSSYFQTYIEKDIKDVLNIRDESAFINFVKATASLSGEMLNYKCLSEVCGKDEKTIKSWLSVLESGGIIFMLEPYFNNFNKRMIKTPKLYFLDTGFACWLLGWNTPQQMINGAAWGHIFESFVIGEILKSYYNDGISKPPLFFYRDKDKNEIDCIIREGNTLYPVEIKTTSDPKRSMVNAFACLSRLPNIHVAEGAVICMAKEPLPLTDQVTIWPANRI